MNYQLIIFLSKKEIMAIDITEDGYCEEISIDGNLSMNYASAEDFSDFRQYICDAYNVDTIEEMEACATIVNCGTDTDVEIALLDELKDFKGIDCIDAKKLLPVIAQQKGLLKKDSKQVFSIIGNYFVVKCDSDGIATVGKNKVTEAVELTGADFAFLYFFKSEGSGISEEEIAKCQNEMAKIKEEAKAEVEIAKETAKSEIASIEKKYAAMAEELAAYKKMVDAIEAEKSETSCMFQSVHIGEIVKFGRYYIDNSGTKKEIEWQVLDKEEDRMLLISKYGLDAIQFNPNGISCRWITCTLHNWLYDVFLKTAFSSKEVERIIATNVEPGVYDKVFLLSYAEAKKYFSDNYLRRCEPTDCIRTQCARTSNGNCEWWLRTPGNYSRSNAYVNRSGELCGNGAEVSRTDLCVRPALWIKLKD